MKQEHTLRRFVQRQDALLKEPLGVPAGQCPHGHVGNNKAGALERWELPQLH